MQSPFQVFRLKAKPTLLIYIINSKTPTTILLLGCFHKNYLFIIFYIFIMQKQQRKQYGYHLRDMKPEYHKKV